MCLETAREDTGDKLVHGSLHLQASMGLYLVWKASLPRSEGHLKAFRFSIVFNWYVYDQEGDKL